MARGSAVSANKGADAPRKLIWIKQGTAKEPYDAFLLEETADRVFVLWNINKQKEWLRKENITILQDRGRGRRRRTETTVFSPSIGQKTHSTQLVSAGAMLGKKSAAKESPLRPVRLNRHRQYRPAAPSYYRSRGFKTRNISEEKEEVDDFYEGEENEDDESENENDGPEDVEGEDEILGDKHFNMDDKDIEREEEEEEEIVVKKKGKVFKHMRIASSEASDGSETCLHNSNDEEGDEEKIDHDNQEVNASSEEPDSGPLLHDQRSMRRKKFGEQRDASLRPSTNNKTPQKPAPTKKNASASAAKADVIHAALDSSNESVSSASWNGNEGSNNNNRKRKRKSSSGTPKNRRSQHAEITMAPMANGGQLLSSDLCNATITSGFRFQRFFDNIGWVQGEVVGVVRNRTTGRVTFEVNFDKMNLDSDLFQETCYSVE